MHSQLTIIATQLEATLARARAVTEGMDEAAFHRRPSAGRWAVAECLGHLNLTSAAFLPTIDRAITEGRARARPPSPRYRRDLAGWLLCRALEPPPRLRFRTTPSFVPPSAAARDVVLAQFASLQAALLARLEAASGLDLNRLRVPSPFNRRLGYNLYSAFCLIAAHQRRHLWQAERARQALGLS